jgi:hypothetical protein
MGTRAPLPAGSASPNPITLPGVSSLSNRLPIAPNIGGNPALGHGNIPGTFLLTSSSAISRFSLWWI